MTNPADHSSRIQEMEAGAAAAPASGLSGRRRRSRSLGVRLVLIALGVLLGVAARWLFPHESAHDKPVFDPLPLAPADDAKADSTAHR